MVKLKTPLLPDERDRLLQCLELRLIRLEADMAILFTMMADLSARVLDENQGLMVKMYKEIREGLIHDGTAAYRPGRPSSKTGRTPKK